MDNGLLCGILLALCPLRLLSVEREVRLTMGASHFSGDYHRDDRTNISYFPTTLQYRQFPWLTKLTVPYVRIKGNTIIGLVSEGEINRRSRTAGGLGDIILTQSIQYVPKFLDTSVVNFSVKIKFPTADKNKGLGTGKYDFTLESRFLKQIGQYTPLIAVGYIFVGEPENIQLNNRFYTNVGGSYRFHHQFQAGLMYEYKQASSESRDSDQKIVGFFSWKPAIKSPWSISGYSVLGLTSASPDYGGGLSFSYTYK
jgi:hypothetical protein